jgi:hypothetical protein
LTVNTTVAGAGAGMVIDEEHCAEVIGVLGVIVKGLPCVLQPLRNLAVTPLTSVRAEP